MNDFRSSVINSICGHTAASRAYSIAFFYCSRNSAEPERADPAKIMGALLRQFASSSPDTPIKEPVAREYEARKRQADDDCSRLKELTIDDCTRLILELTHDSQATIVIDALDECDDSGQLLRALQRIVRESKELVKIFVTSREDVDIVSFFLPDCYPQSPSAVHWAPSVIDIG